MSLRIKTQQLFQVTIPVLPFPRCAEIFSLQLSGRSDVFILVEIQLQHAARCNTATHSLLSWVRKRKSEKTPGLR